MIGMEEGASKIEVTAAEGFLYGSGMVKEKSNGKAFLHHYFAAQGGSLQSKMALAYSYMRQEMYDEAVKLYAELAEAAVTSSSITKDSSVVEAAQKGNAIAMYKRGIIRRLFEWLKLASKQKLYSAYNGIGYLYVKGYGVEKKNYTKAKEYFEKAAANEEAGGCYNLGVMYLKGIGVTRDVKLACKYFMIAANAGQPKAFYQLAKIFHTGIGLKKNSAMATLLYKLVAERGPWGSFSRWALEAYFKGDIGKALFLYLRMAELGYEVAQSKAAWILDKYGDRSLCMGEGGLCSDVERHERSHSLWWQASEQGNEHAALLIGDAYYHVRGTERDYERLPHDLHLAKRYYDQALETYPKAKLPVALALASLWIRKNYANSFLVNVIDSLPDVYPKVEAWVEDVIVEEGNATILTLFVCLLTVLYLRERQRRNATAGPAEVLGPRDPANPNPFHNPNAALVF
ncbi:hypothetical protein MLD38_031610 [Melastoma candidum]|uniref:Uncharacterized protein n=1 Tax=Melastoma candidum TaxID=119954 RepID=A0ACB9MTK3_9MYRT|nr:hypothetical protein MLD38_031610 [Melastoma candidum]